MNNHSTDCGLFLSKSEVKEGLNVAAMQFDGRLDDEVENE